MVALIFVATFSTSLMFFPTTSQQSAANAQFGTVLSDVKEILQAVEEIFCSGERPRVCKGTECLKANCISFRKKCTSNSDCSDSTPPRDGGEK